MSEPKERRALADDDAERGVLCSILLDPRVADDVAPILRPSDFLRDKNRRIYQAVVDLAAESKAPELPTLVERLRETSQFEEIGGEAYLGELMTAEAVAAHAVRYARKVADTAKRRALADVCRRALDEASDPSVKTPELLARVETDVFKVGDERETSVVAAPALVDETLRLIELQATGALGGTPTGFRELDRIVGGLRNSELIVIAARPSMGKTALATNVAERVAVDLGKPTLFTSLETSRTDLTKRMLCARARIAPEAFNARLSETAQAKLDQAAREIRRAPLFVDDAPNRTVAQIGASARRIKRREGLALVVVDYLGLIAPDNPRDPRQEQVARISRSLKGLARELSAPVVCLAQLNRQTEQTKDNRPRLSHLRESGAIEQDADVVMFVHREEYYHTKEEAEDKGIVGLAEIIVAKQRNGPTGTARLVWEGRFTKFSNMARAEEEADFFDEFSQFS